MSTVYTYHNKVLKNSANDKWLAMKEAPAGFVMNATNATITVEGGSLNNIYVAWESPAYPSGYNGNGKQYILVNNNTTSNVQPLLYSMEPDSGGPDIISRDNMAVIDTSTGVLLNNPAGGTFGKYLVWPFQGYTLEQVQAYMANVTITILDP